MKWLLDPKTLQLFASVAELGTIAAAAKKENIAASALSKRISDLEYSVGAVLIDRSNSGINLTEAGGKFLSLAIKALNEYGALQEKMSDYVKGSSGRLRIVADISSMTQFLIGELKSFQSAHRDVRIHLEEAANSEVARRVLDKAADIGFLVAGEDIGGVDFHAYRNDEIVVICSNDHALAGREEVRFTETLDFEYVGLSANSDANRILLKAAGDLERVLKLNMHVHSYDVLCQIVESGLGLGAIPAQIAALYGRRMNIRVIRLEEKWATRTLEFCVRSYETLSIVAQKFIDHIDRNKFRNTTMADPIAMHCNRCQAM